MTGGGVNNISYNFNQRQKWMILILLNDWFSGAESEMK